MISSILKVSDNVLSDLVLQASDSRLFAQDDLGIGVSESVPSTCSDLLSKMASIEGGGVEGVSVLRKCCSTAWEQANQGLIQDQS